MPKIIPNRLTYFLAAIVVPVAKLLHLLTSNLCVSAIKARRLSGLNVQPSDIFLCTYPKSGTTWLQMILFQIASDGDLGKIRHMGEEIPHLEETSPKVQPVLLQSPRIFKTHLPYGKVPRGGRYIHVMRNGMDVANSYYHHYAYYKGFKGSFELFFRMFLDGKVAYGSWFEHTAGWMKHRHDPNILFLSYEELSDDLEGTIHKIIDFCGFRVDPDEMPRILERSSFAYMKAHQEKLDISTFATRHRQDLGYQLIREGKVGAGRQQLGPAQLRGFNEKLDRQLSGMGLDAYRAS